MYNGGLAAINGIGNVAVWNLSETAEKESITNSATRQGTARSYGTKDTSGGYTAHGGLPSVLPGESFQFIGYAGPTSGVRGTAGTRYTQDVIVSQIQVMWDFAANKVVKHTVSFLGNGPLVIASGGAVLDVTSLKKVKSSDCSFVYGGTTPLVPNRQTATLTITSKLAELANASTGGWKKRERGPVDWTLSIPTNEKTPLFSVGTLLEDIKLYINATDYWMLSDGSVEQSTDVTCNVETASIESMTINIGMESNDSAGTVGFIKKPADAANNWWPWTT